MKAHGGTHHDPKWLSKKKKNVGHPRQGSLRADDGGVQAEAWRVDDLSLSDEGSLRADDGFFGRKDVKMQMVVGLRIPGLGR